MASSNKFSTKIGLVAATVGSAVGLGNIWRFPAEAQQGGGAAFLLLYILCVFVLGIPVMLAEFSLGRAGGSDSVGNFKNLTPKSKWWIAGTVGLIASCLILSFYMVVAGWTLEYVFDSITGDLYAGYNAIAAEGGDTNGFFVSRMTEYITTSTNPLIWTYIMIAINVGVLVMGVKGGIEKASNVLMPLLFVLLLVFCGVALSLPGASRGLEFFLRPDISKITGHTVISALGQAFFSLSLGMGILVTYSAYYPSTTPLKRVAVTVSMLDFVVAFLMGLIIFPAMASFGLDASGANAQGTTLVFVTLPEIFADMSATRLWSTLFFLLLSVAALTSTISVAEVSVAFVCDRFKIRRVWAVLIVMVPLIVTSTLCSLSLTPGSPLRILDYSLFDAFDTFTTDILLPVSALLICLYVGWRLPRHFLWGQLTNNGTLRGRATALIIALIRYVAPVLIVAILIAGLF